MVTVQTTSIPVMHFEHRLWLNKLKFYRQEIAILEQILEKARQKQPGRVVETELEKKSRRHVYEIKIVDEKDAAAKRVSDALWKRLEDKTLKS